MKGYGGRCVLWAALILLAGCGGGKQRTEAYQLRIESAAELVAGQASACLTQIRSYWAVAEYAKASDMSFEEAAREMQTGQTRQNLRMMEDCLKSFVGNHLHLPEDELTRGIEKLIRAFDPCISCSAH